MARNLVRERDRDSFTETRQHLEACGWRHLVKLSGRVAREAYGMDHWEVLCESSPQPWITVRRMRGKTVDWYCDIPREAGIYAAIGLMQVCDQMANV